jgi:hypothetical protein
VIAILGGLVLALILLVAGALGGLALGDWMTGHRSRALDAREADLNAEWDAVQTVHRLQAASLEARQAMRGVAARHRRKESLR